MPAPVASVADLRNRRCAIVIVARQGVQRGFWKWRSGRRLRGHPALASRRNHTSTSSDQLGGGRGEALEPVAGRLAEALFAVGLFGAIVLAATIMALSTAFVICEAFGWESGADKRFSDARAFFSIYTLVLAAGALVVLLPGLDLLPVLIASQNLQGLLLPFVLVFMVLLVNDARLMGAHRNVVLDIVLLGVVALELVGIDVG